MRYLLCLILFCISSTGFGQNSQFYIITTIHSEALQLEKPYYIESIDDSIVVTKLKYYFSAGIIEPSNYLLYDLSKSDSMALPASVSASEELLLSIGIDSLTNMAGVQGGALDPMNDMYWTWNSGYINFKLEGHSAAINTRKNKFQLHLGGFLAPYNAHRQLVLATEKKGPVVIELALDDFLNKIDMKTTHTVMSPSATSMELSDYLAESFRLRNE